MNDVKLDIGHNGDRSLFNGNSTAISDFEISQNPLPFLSRASFASNRS
jgi:hypothetical protein